MKLWLQITRRGGRVTRGKMEVEGETAERLYLRQTGRYQVMGFCYLEKYVEGVGGQGGGAY